MEDEKQLRWVGSAYDDLLAFPKDSRREAGFQLGKVRKKTQVTSTQDKAIASARFRAAIGNRKERK